MARDASTAEGGLERVVEVERAIDAALGQARLEAQRIREEADAAAERAEKELEREIAERLRRRREEGSRERERALAEIEARARAAIEALASAATGPQVERLLAALLDVAPERRT